MNVQLTFINQSNDANNAELNLFKCKIFALINKNHQIG
jgi:hypothetical protein